MNTQNFKSKIKEIRKEALEIGFSINTMNNYLSIWNKYINWKNLSNFDYNEEEYVKFLLEYYNFDISTFSSKSKSHHQQLMRSKRILDDFDSYKQFMLKRVLPNSLYSNYPSSWNLILDKYLEYCKQIKLNVDKSIKLKQSYLERLLSYFYKNDILEIKNINKEIIIIFLNNVIEKGEVSKRRNFNILRDFLNYLFVENIILTDLSVYIPKIRATGRKKLPTYLKKEKIEELLDSIPRETKVEIRDYAIIIIAARLGLRINDILNIKLKNIDWKNNKITVLQTKNNNLNSFPLLKDVGWAIIDYIRDARPKCNNEYLFVKTQYPFEKMEQFNSFNKYFEKVEQDIDDNRKKGIHNLRSSLATNMLEDNIPISIIASTLGDTLEVTSKTYIKVNNNLLKKCALEVEE